MKNGSSIESSHKHQNHGDTDDNWDLDFEINEF